MSSLKEIFQKFVDLVEPEIKQVSKRFAPSIESEVRDDSFTIFASPYIRVLIDGRKPTSPSAPKGNPTLQQILLEWIRDKSIQPDKPTMTQEQLSWAISRSMHTKGDLLYQRGGGNNIFDKILTTERENKLLSLISEFYYVQITSIVEK